MARMFLFLIIFFSLFITSAYAMVVDYENEWAGVATVIAVNGNIVSLSIKRESGTSTTIIDCKRGLTMDSRFSADFEEPDRQSPGLAYIDDFC